MVPNLRPFKILRTDPAIFLLEPTMVQAHRGLIKNVSDVLDLEQMGNVLSLYEKILILITEIEEYKEDAVS